MMAMGARYTPHVCNGMRLLSVLGVGILGLMPVVRLFLVSQEMISFKTNRKTDAIPL